MLQTMRNLAQSWIVKGLMAILIVSFSIWGIGDIFRGNTLQRTVAKTGSLAITVQDLRQEFSRNLTQVRQSLGPDFTEQQAKQMGLMSMTLNNMIARLQVRQEITRYGIDPSDKTMAAVFEAVPQFQDQDGKFNEQRMLDHLESQGQNENDFINHERQDLARHTLIDVFAAKNPPPASIIDTLYRARGQKRVLDVLTLRNNSITENAAPDDKTLRNFYNQNPDKFTAPEYRSLTIARLSTEDVAKDIVVHDEDLQKEYDLRSAQFDRPERRELIQVVLQDETKALKLFKAAKSKGDLSLAAKDQGYQAISLGETDKNGLLPELAGPVFDLKSKQVSSPIKSSLGWHVIQVKNIIPAGKPSFDSLKEHLRDLIQKDRAADEVAKLVNQLDDELAAGHTLEDVSDSLKIRLIKVPLVTESGLQTDGKEPSELPFKSEALKQAFSQNSGDTSPVLDDKQGNYYVVRTDDVQPSALKPFDDIKDDVVSAWRTQQNAALAKVEAEKIAAALRDGKKVSSFSSRKGLEIHLSKPIDDIGDQDPIIPENLVSQILKMKKGNTLTWSLPDHQLILHLVSITEAEEKDSRDAKNIVTRDLNEAMPKEYSSEYLKYLRQVYPVTIKQDVLDTLIQ